MRTLLILIAAFFAFEGKVLAQNGTRTSRAYYSHSTVGTTAQDAILAASVQRDVYGWVICHDAADTPTYLAFSDGADPATDGTRIAPGQCYKCDLCGYKTLLDLNVKGQAAGTGYSIIQYK